MSNQWAPSILAHMGRDPFATDAVDYRNNALRSGQNISRGSTGSIDSYNQEYETDAERPEAVAPFLADNIYQNDRNGGTVDRRHVVLSGGDIVYPPGEAQRVSQTQNITVPTGYSLADDRGVQGQPDIPGAHYSEGAGSMATPLSQRGRRMRGSEKVSFPDYRTSFGHFGKGQFTGYSTGNGNGGHGGSF